MVTVEKVEVAEEKSIESAAEAAAFELARDIESTINMVRGDRNILLQALDMLREEYLTRDTAEWSDVRGALRDLFDAGNRELDAINRVLDQIQRQAEEYRRAPAEFRDGMLTESVRELVDSANRRSGETGALSDALNSVAALLREKRQTEEAVPSERELVDLFNRTHDQAMSKWLVQSGKNDPMGRELSERMAVSTAN